MGLFGVDLEIVGPAKLRQAATRLSERYASAAG